jgi:hypothetical protein
MTMSTAAMEAGPPKMKATPLREGHCVAVRAQGREIGVLYCALGDGCVHFMA